MARPEYVTGKGKAMRYALFWLLGVPIPVLIVIWLLFN
jgi:hypothetical protein